MATPLETLLRRVEARERNTRRTQVETVGDGGLFQKIKRPLVRDRGGKKNRHKHR